MKMKTLAHLTSAIKAIALLALLTLTSFTVQAADGTWANDASGNWGTAGNWTGSTIASDTDGTASFTLELTGTRIITLDSARKIGNITFTDTTPSHDLTISGSNLLTLDVSSGAPIIDVTQAGRTLTLSCPVAGNDGLKKNGSGTLMLSGANTYTGTTTLNGGTLALANYYSATPLAMAGSSTINLALNFPSYWAGPLTGSSTLTTTGYFGSLLYLINNASNTFNGNIIVDSGTLRVAGSPFGANGGFTAPSMTSANTITINRAGSLYIDDNVNSSVASYTADRFGTAGNRPSVNLAGGTITLNGLNNASSSVQTFGNLTVSSGQATLFVTRFSGNPTFTFNSLSVSKGAVANFYSATLGTGTSDSRITFSTPPTLVNGILAGAKYWSPGAAGQGEFATYGANGVRAFTASDYTVYNTMDINAATATENVQMTGAFSPVTLTADRSINSLNFNGNGGTWSLGGFKLTIGSGMILRNGTNQAITFDNGTLTAGNGTDAINLNIFTAQQNVTINAVIADNASSVLTLVKSHGNTLALSGTADNTYSGGTYVVDGQITTGTTANRRYLGTGKAFVDNAILQLGNVGATSNSSGDDYTAINGGQITIASGTAGVYTSADTFNLSANSIIAGGSASGQGLASLTRGANVTLTSGAIIGQGALTAALNTTIGTIQNLGTSADLYYGLTANQNNAAGSIEIGSGTAFKGISTDRNATGRSWQLGTINIASGTPSVDFQGFPIPGAAPIILTLGNGTTAGAPVINFAGSGTVDINAIGPLTLNDDTATYGNTGSSQNVRFVATAGSTILVNTATGMGSGTGIASALVQNGGTFAVGANSIPNALNGAVTVESGGKYLANRAGGLTGDGLLTFNAGSLIEITVADSFSGSQASATSIAAGTIVRLNANSFGAAGTTLDSVLGSGANAPIFVIYGNNRTAAEPTVPGTTILTLNKDINGVGGILTNFEVSNRGLGATINGVVTVGANGGTIASTTGNSMAVAEDIKLGGNLTLGTTDIIDGLPKLGAVTISGAMDFGGSGRTITVISGLSGTSAATISAAISNTGGVNGLTKNGAGTLILSTAQTYTGVTTINEGVLRLGNATSLPGGIGVSGGTSALTLNGGVIGLGIGSFLRALGTGSDQVQWTGSGGFAAYGGARSVNLGNAGATVTWNSGSFVPTGSSLILSSLDSDNTLTWANPIDFNGAVRTIQVDNGTAATDASISVALSNGGLNKTGLGTLGLAAANSYNGDTTISAGTLTLTGSGTLGTSANIIIASGATLDVSAPTAALTLGADQTLKCSATGATPSATITVASGKNVTLGGTTTGLAFTAYGGGAIAPLTVVGAAGSLDLNGKPLTVTTTAKLSAGAYKLIAASGAGATVTGTPGTLTINGRGGSATLRVTAGELFMDVSASGTLIYFM